MKQEVGITDVGEDLRGARILVVDDEEANVRLLERMLRQVGYRDVRSATDGREALRIFDELDPDVVLLDLHMPHMDGYETMREIGLRNPSDTYLPILVLTADVTAGAKQRALAGGANDFLTKPLDQVEVLLRVRNLLETRFLHLRLLEQNRDLEVAVRERTKELRERAKELDENIDALRSVDRQRRDLLAHLVSAQEEERARIAADIHDDSIQVMTAVGMRLGVLRRRASLHEEAESVEKLDETVRGAIGRLRNLIFELHPRSLDEEGLAPSLRLYLDRVREEAGIEYGLDNGLVEEPDSEVRTTMYRIVQEAISNVRKHASASRIDVLLRPEEDGILVRIRDDGRGFEPAEGGAIPGHLGLPSMRERAELAGGWWRIESAPGEGTTVEFWVPTRV